MQPAELEALLAGLLRLWQVQAGLKARRDGEDALAIIETSATTVTVWHGIQSFGPVWHVQAVGGRRHAYPSTIGMIRDLRATLAPERGAARVVFAAAAGG